MSFIKRVINEEIILFENLQQAEKILKEKGIDLNDKDFLEFKNTLIKNNNGGYLGLITNMAVKHNSFDKFYFFDGNAAQRIYTQIINNKPYLNSLPKQLMQYTDPNELTRDIIKIADTFLVKKLSNKLTNKNLKQQLLTYQPDNNIKEEISYFLNIDSADQKEFLSKTDKYNNINNFIEDLSAFNGDHKIGFKYSTVLNKIKSMPKTDITLLLADEQKQIILARILQYNASRELGSTSWCIVGEEEQFNDYVKNGNNYQYFFFNFNPNTESNLKMIAFTLDAENNITAAHDRYNNQYNPIEYLNSLGVKEKLYLINSRERAKSIVDSKLGDVHKVVRIINDKEFSSGDKDINSDFIYKLYYILRNNVFNNKNHLDLIINKLENYPVKIYENDFNEDYFLRNSTENIIPDILSAQEFDRIPNPKRGKVNIIQNNIYLKEAFLKFFINVYQSNINLTQESKMAIMHFLKDNGVDILKLSQQKKAARGTDLSDMEFAMLKNKGENLKPIIQNKLSAIRRGEDINMSVSEIKYAIENGYKNIITFYYNKMLNNYYHNQLDYHTLQIYQMLGMFPNIEKVILTKANNYGIDALNSIEKSIVDMARKKNSVISK